MNVGELFKGVGSLDFPDVVIEKTMVGIHFLPLFCTNRIVNPYALASFQIRDYNLPC